LCRGRNRAPRRANAQPGIRRGDTRLGEYLPDDRARRRRHETLIRVEIGGLDAGLATARKLADNDPDSGLYDVVSAELYKKA
jgi:hypothetical protein